MIDKLVLEDNEREIIGVFLENLNKASSFNSLEENTTAYKSLEKLEKEFEYSTLKEYVNMFNAMIESCKAEKDFVFLLDNICNHMSKALKELNESNSMAIELFTIYFLHKFNKKFNRYEGKIIK